MLRAFNSRPSGLMQITRKSTNKIKLTIAVTVVSGIRSSYSVLTLGDLEAALEFFAAALPLLEAAVFFFEAELAAPFPVCLVLFFAID